MKAFALKIFETSFESLSFFNESLSLFAFLFKFIKVGGFSMLLKVFAEIFILASFDEQIVKKFRTIHRCFFQSHDDGLMWNM